MSTQPLQQVVQEDANPAATGVTNSTVASKAPFAGTVSAVTYTPLSAVTGANTNTRKLELINRGQAGAGTTVIASIQFDSGVNAAAMDEKALTLSATAANLVVVAGDILEWKSSAVGTGLADPGGLFNVTFTRGDVSA